MLGGFCLIDQGEIDWKIVTISDTDPDFNSFNNLDDVKRIHPGLLP